MREKDFEITVLWKVFPEQQETYKKLEIMPLIHKTDTLLTPLSGPWEDMLSTHTLRQTDDFI